jgi:methylmalonyl-CoA mutase
MGPAGLDAELRRLFPGLGGEAQRESWTALARKALKGDGVDVLRREGPDRIVFEPLYTDEHACELPPLGRAALAGELAWDIRTSVEHAAPGEANRRILEDLENGASSILLSLDPTEPGRLALASATELELALRDVILDVAPICLDAGFLGPIAADWLAAAAKGGPAAPLGFNLDPLTAFAREGRSPGPIQAHLEASARQGAELAADYARASLFLATGRAVHEAGGSPAVELAFAISAAVAYAKALADQGLPIKAAFTRIVLGVSVDAEHLLSLAKGRAARLLWDRVVEACGASAPARIEARSSRRMLTAVDAWTNLLRLTAAGFAAAAGGADAILLDPFTQPMGAPSDLARRQARNIQLLLMDEAGLDAVADPASGSWALDRMTSDLAQAAWTRFQAIERAGGLLEALQSGLISTWTEEARRTFQAELVSGERPILGVTLHAASEVPPAPLGADAAARRDPPPTSLPGPDDTCPPLTPMRWSAAYEPQGN